jgi:hypothetical protein
MNKLSWHTIPQSELALLLGQARLDESRAVGPATVYQLTVEGRDVLAIALADGQALLVESHAAPKPNRRQRTPLKP